MNHYPHHIGDFNSATRHLTFVERALYRELLDLYYDTERPLNQDVNKVARRVLANTEEQRAALDIVLEEFFTLEDDGWHNARCDREIEAYRQKQEQQSRAGRASAAKRGGGKDGASGGNAKTAPVMPPLDDSFHAGADAVERPLNDRSTNQNQNQNQNQSIPPNPPAGGMSDGFAVASELQGYFPEHRRTRLADVAKLVEDLVTSGKASVPQLLAAAAKQSATLGKDGGKACPGVLRWLRESRWLDALVGQQGDGGVPADWSATRSGVEAMGERLGLGRWDEGADRVFASYERRVNDALKHREVAGVM